MQILMPTVEEASDLADVFRLMGDPNRVRILYALLEAGELCVAHIAEAVETSETKVSQAMRLLRSAGVVRNRRAGRNIYYRLDDSHVQMILEMTREHLAHSGAEAGIAHSGTAHSGIAHSGTAHSGTTA